MIRKLKVNAVKRYQPHTVTEGCPHCNAENTFEWDPEQEGYKAYCCHCGSEMMLCTECMGADDNPTCKCDWHQCNGECLCFRRCQNNNPTEKTLDKLTDEEYNLLNKIARKTKMDCWFAIDGDEYEGKEWIVDIEEEITYDLKEGIDYLMQGLDCIENFTACNLTSKEVLTLNDLLNKLELPTISNYLGYAQ